MPLEFVIEKDDLRQLGPAFSFECPLCDSVIHPNLSETFARNIAIAHLAGYHHVRPNKLNIVIKEKQ